MTEPLTEPLTKPFTEPLTEPLIDFNSKLFTEEMDIYSMENEIQGSLEGSEEISPSQFGNTEEDYSEVIAKREEKIFAKRELWCTFPQRTSVLKFARVRCACEKYFETCVRCACIYFNYI